MAWTSIAFESARRLMPKAAWFSAAGLVPLWVAAGFVIPAFYGPSFDAAVTPTRIVDPTGVGDAYRGGLTGGSRALSLPV